ncbi:hypothetical protein GOP47_0009199 [Adiantum capillus-veneris]|uniref:Uncharacterized protein n=1 Tax=Adiantum capillus-veneris TaxID=13818 RepID=A0A9D4UX29_ADICA|nr:hypothetical protein GOP47_0009199 [Adiantum capillus-veneris]
MVVTSFHQAMATAGLQREHHYHHRWSSPRCTFYGRHFQVSRQRFSVSRADSQERRSPGDDESKEVLDAFFLGKAFAEAVTERLGTVVGELLSDVGRWQAEQQKQVRDFQDEVQERAKKARVKALQEARSVDRKEVKSVSQNGASLPAGRDDKAVPLKRPDTPQDSTSL